MRPTLAQEYSAAAMATPPNNLRKSGFILVWRLRSNMLQNKGYLPISGMLYSILIKKCPFVLIYV